MDLIFLMYIIIIVQFIFISLIIVSIFYKGYLFSSEFINKINVLTGLLTITSVLLLYFQLNTQYNQAVNESTLNMIDRGFIDINKEMSDNYEKCPNFINSLKFKFLNDEQQSHQYNNQKGDNQITINFIANKIFQAIEDRIITENLTLTKNHVWVGTFLSYLSSKQLRDKWVKLKYSFGKRTHSYVNLLIKTINENNFKNADDVLVVSKRLVNNNEYANIFKNVNRDSTDFE